MTDQKISHTIRAGAGIVGALALGLMLSVPASVQAQQTGATNASNQITAGATTVRQAMNQFADKYGTPIIQRGAISGSAQTTLSLAAGGSAKAREEDIARLADAADARWHRMFFVTPATSDKPVTMLADAKTLTTDAGAISLQIKRVSLEAAARAFAAASGSEVTLTDALTQSAGGSVTIPSANLTAAQVIARMAAQTKTHWSVGYVLQPLPPGSARLARRTQDPSNQPIAVTGAASNVQAADANSNPGYPPVPYIQTNLNGNPYEQVTQMIPDGYDQNGNPYYYNTGSQSGSGSYQGSYQNPYAGNSGNYYPGYYGSPMYGGTGAGGFTTTSPTYYGYGYGAGTDPYSAGITQQNGNFNPGASAFPGGPESGLGFTPYFGTVFSSGSAFSGGSTTLTP